MKQLIITVQESDDFSIVRDEFTFNLDSFDLLVDKTEAVMKVIAELRGSVERG